MRAIDVVRKVAKRARPEYVQAFENGDAILSKAGINTPLRLAHFLAQVMHESGGLTIQWENMNYKASRIMEIFGEGVHSAKISASEAQHLAGKPSALAERVYGVGNPRKAKEFSNTNPGDGYRYRGGGLMQTTGKSNYRRMGKLCGVDFEKNPELVVSAEHALKPAVAEWTEGKLNALADRGDLHGITRKINGGYNGLADRQAWFKKIRPLIDSVDFEFKPDGGTVKPAAPPPDVPKPEPEKEPWYKRGFMGWVLGLIGSLVGGSSLTITDEIIYATCALIGVLCIALAFWVYVIPPRGSFKIWR